MDPRTKIYLGETIRYIPSGVIGEREYNYAKNNPIFYIDVSGLACAPPSCETPSNYPKCNAECQKIYLKGLGCCAINYKPGSASLAACQTKWKNWVDRCMIEAPVDCPP